jgi:hypothetical protein
MVVIWSSDDNCIEFGLFEEFTVIEVFFCVRKTTCSSIEGVGLCIAKGHNVFRADSIEIPGTPSSDSDRPDIEPIVCAKDSSIAFRTSR